MLANIPILDLTRQYRAIKDEIDRAVLDVLAAGVYINGPNVRALEDEIARYAGTQHAVALTPGPMPCISLCERSTSARGTK